MPARGISLVSPDEKGWFVFDPDGKGSSLVKSGPTKSESHAITITYMQSTGLESEKEFLDTVKQKTGSSDDRFKIREKNEELDRSRGTYFAKYYRLSEDHGAHQMPKERTIGV